MHEPPGPIARSPIPAAQPLAELGGWEVSARRSTAGLTITDLTSMTKVAVRAPFGGAVQQALGVPFGRVARHPGLLDGSLVVGSGPGEWLVLAPVGTAGRTCAQLAVLVRQTTEFCSVIDLTHGRALLRIRGPRSARLLAKVCAVDLSDAVTPDGAAFRSSVAAVVTDVLRDDVDGVRSYLLHCERSSGRYLIETLLDAGAEFGVDVDGFPG